MNSSNAKNFTDAPQHETVHIESSFKPLIPRFMANRKKEVAAMIEALAAQNFETVRSLSHGMKGTGGSYGFDRISELAAAIEQAAKISDTSVIQATLPVLASYLERIDVIYDD